MKIELDVIRKRNLLIWSQTRFRCATKSWRKSSCTVKILCFFSFQYSFFWVSIMSIFPWIDIILLETKNSRSSFQDLSLISWKKLHKIYCWWILTSTWFEHATFWSGVSRATVAPRIPGENRAVRLKDRVFFLPVFTFLSLKCVYLSLNWRGFSWNKEIPIKFPGRLLNSLQKTTQILRLANIDFDVIRTLNLQRIEPYCYTFVFFSFQQPFFVFLKIVDLSLKWGTFTWKTNPEKVSRPFLNFF